MNRELRINNARALRVALATLHDPRDEQGHAMAFLNPLREVVSDPPRYVEMIGLLAAEYAEELATSRGGAEGACRYLEQRITALLDDEGAQA